MARTKVRGTTQIKPDTVSKVETDLTVVTTDGAAPFVADQSMTGHKLIDLADPTVAQDAVTKAYADGAIAVAVTYSEPLTNGDPVNPEIMFDSNGDVIMVEFP